MVVAVRATDVSLFLFFHYSLRMKKQNSFISLASEFRQYIQTRPYQNYALHARGKKKDRPDSACCYCSRQKMRVCVYLHTSREKDRKEKTLQQKQTTISIYIYTMHRVYISLCMCVCIRVYAIYDASLFPRALVFSPFVSSTARKLRDFSRAA